MKKIALALVAFGMSVSSFAQSTPYFQQDVKFKIDVKLDDERNMLYGNEELIYTNNSPVALNEIYIRTFDINLEIEGCPSCWRDYVSNLKQIYDANTKA